jgi:hypothetical protein
MAGMGLPAFQFIQDPLDYGSRVHHSNLDTFDHLRTEDLRQAAVIMATVLLQAAESDTADAAREDILAARDALRAKGATILGTGEPRIGAHGTPILFVHPKDMGGVLVELMETPKANSEEGAH